MTVEDEGRLIAIIAVVLILAFVGGLILAFFVTLDWRWLILSLISGAMILWNVRRG